MLLNAAVLAVSLTAPGFSKATGEANVARRDAAEIIKAMVAKGAPLSRLADALLMSAKLNNVTVLECLLQIEADRSILSKEQKRLLGPRLLYACNFSVEKDSMSKVVRKYGFEESGG